jgi:serine/threonine protein kinase/Tol biopolymer transport system component
MKPERWQQIESLFQAALRYDAGEREEFLRKVCAEDESLRHEVESLLFHHRQAEDFIESPAYQMVAPSIAGEVPRLPKGERIGIYTIVELIGSGGMGQVYLAKDERLGRKVALKLLPGDVSRDEKRLLRFEQEARAASTLSHPNVAHIYELGKANAITYIAMEFVDGVPLRQRIAESRLKLDEALDIAQQVAAALVAAHSMGLVHRDIKPENIMMRSDGYVKVLDFGLAKLIETASVNSEAPTALVKTEPGMVMGTTQYMSPEQARGRGVDSRADIWSLGVVIYEMLTTHRPFEGYTASDVIAAVLEREPPTLNLYVPEVPTELQRIVRKALAKDRDERYQTARDLLIDLKNLRRELELQSELERSVVPSLQTSSAGAAQPAHETETDSLRQTGDVPKARPTSSAEYLIGEIKRHRRGVIIGLAGLIAIAAIITGGVFLSFHRSQGELRSTQRTLTRLTFDAGLQGEPTWSPDGRFIAYSSDKSGNFDIWVQPAGEGNAVQVTHSPAHDWQPDWSPDGKRIAFRSEREGGGLYIVPALGGSERKFSSFGYHPRWSPDGSKILFDTQIASLAAIPTLYLASLDGSPPREVFTDFLKDFATLGATYVSWHPDSRRLSVLAFRGGVGQEFWTVAVDGGAPVKSDVSPEVERRLKEASVRLQRFIWSPSGQSLYFEGISRGVKNVWRITVDPTSLRWIAGPERLTTGPGEDSDISVSSDGKKLAFTIRTESTRVWVLPFDPVTGQIKGGGKPETSAAVNAWSFDLSGDGKKLAYVALRPEKQELWQKSLDDESEKLLVAADEYLRGYPRWSRDGTQLAYRRTRPLKSGDTGGAASIVVLPSRGGDEQIITSNGWGDGPKDWFSDGQRLLALTTRPDGKRWKIWIVPISAGPRAEEQAREIASDPDYNFYQPHLSPDERWICFMKVKATEPGIANLYVMPTSGGEQTRITEGKYYDDKVCWSPDGKTIYFLSQRGGFFNVWGVHFDPANGKPLGEPFRVTAFESPGRMATPTNTQSEMSVTANRLAMPITELSGSIWVLENVDQ